MPPVLSQQAHIVRPQEVVKMLAEQDNKSPASGRSSQECANITPRLETWQESVSPLANFKMFRETEPPVDSKQHVGRKQPKPTSCFRQQLKEIIPCRHRVKPQHSPT